MKKKIIALILAGALIWIGAMWYDTPVKKELRSSNISWERW
jgi:hypothetical protein